MYRWYERESGQEVDQAVIDRVFYETQGQPGLVSWLGELLTETYNHDPTQPLTMRSFEETYSAAIHVLPNNNILFARTLFRQTGRVYEPFEDLGDTITEDSLNVQIQFHKQRTAGLPDFG